MATHFSRLVRFEDSDGTVHYGEAGDEWQVELKGLVVPTYEISDIENNKFVLTGQKVKIANVNLFRITTTGHD